MPTPAWVPAPWMPLTLLLHNTRPRHELRKLRGDLLGIERQRPHNRPRYTVIKVMVCALPGAQPVDAVQVLRVSVVWQSCEV